MTSILSEYEMTLSLDERVSQRTNLHKKTTNNILKKSYHEREQYFFKQVADKEEVWTIWENGTLIEYSLSDGVWGVPVWPNKIFVDLFAKPSKIQIYECIPIPINDFSKDVLFRDEPASDVIVFPLKLNQVAPVLEACQYEHKIANELKRFNPENML